MNTRSLVPSLLAAAVLALAGCETNSQGPAPGLDNLQNNQTGQQRIDPAPQSKSYSETKDVFQGAEYDPGTAPAMANARRVQLRVGQVVEVFRSNIIPGGEREMAFYLPVEARSVVQLVVETRGVNKAYFLKAVGVGETVGGVVERRWLNSAGFDPDNTADEARIQGAVRANPYLISVTH